MVYKLRQGKKIVRIGVTNDLKRRLSEHKRAGIRFSSVSNSVKMSRDSALKRERAAIKTYKNNQGRRPRHNKID